MAIFYVYTTYDIYNPKTGYFQTKLGCVEWNTDLFGEYYGNKYASKEECILNNAVFGASQPSITDKYNTNCGIYIVGADVIQKLEDSIEIDVALPEYYCNTYLQYQLYDENHNLIKDWNYAIDKEKWDGCGSGSESGSESGKESGNKQSGQEDSGSGSEDSGDINLLDPNWPINITSCNGLPREDIEKGHIIIAGPLFGPDYRTLPSELIRIFDSNCHYGYATIEGTNTALPYIFHNDTPHPLLVLYGCSPPQAINQTLIKADNLPPNIMDIKIMPPGALQGFSFPSNYYTCAEYGNILHIFWRPEFESMPNNWTWPQSYETYYNPI